YDCVIDYHPGKANVVADALSRKSIVALRSLNAQLSLTHDGVILAEFLVKPNMLQQIQDGQKTDEKLMVVMGKITEGKETEYKVKENGCLYYKERVCVPDDKELKTSILKEAHNSVYAMHPGSTKMYHDLKLQYWWPGMKKDIVDHVTRCLTCQQVKAEHQVPSGLLQPINIPEWKWDRVTMDFVR
ncbi:hypothetical protein P3X46_000681, partial [Hevea brasiliensis]